MKKGGSTCVHISYIVDTVGRPVPKTAADNKEHVIAVSVCNGASSKSTSASKEALRL